MAVSVVNIQTSGDNVDRNAYTTGSFTPNPNRLQLIWVYSINGSTPNVPTVSGCSLTWTQVKTVTDNSALRVLTLFRAFGVLPTTGSLTIDFGGQTQSGCAWSWAELNGMTPTNGGADAIIQSVTGLTAAGTATSLTVTLSAFLNINNATIGGFGIPLNTAAIPAVGSGFTLIGQRNQSTPNLAIASEFNVANDTTVDMNSGAASVPWVGIVAEIEAYTPTSKIPMKPRKPVVDWDNPISKGLIFDMPFFEQGGTKPQDVSPSKTTGTTNSGVSWTPDLFGSTAKFDGSTSKVAVTTIPLQDSLTNVSIGMIFNATNFSSGTGFPRLFQKGNTANGYLDISVDNVNGLQFGVGYNTTPLTARIAKPSLTLWHSLLITYDGSKLAANAKIYLDGVIQTHTLDVDGVGTIADSANLTIGNRQSDTGRAFTGFISSTRLWSRILNAQEAKQLYTNPWQIYQPGFISNLMGI